MLIINFIIKWMDTEYTIHDYITQTNNMDTAIRNFYEYIDSNNLRLKYLEMCDIKKIF